MVPVTAYLVVGLYIDPDVMDDAGNYQRYADTWHADSADEAEQKALDWDEDQQGGTLQVAAVLRDGEVVL